MTSVQILTLSADSLIQAMRNRAPNRRHRTLDAAKLLTKMPTTLTRELRTKRHPEKRHSERAQALGELRQPLTKTLTKVQSSVSTSLSRGRGGRTASHSQRQPVAGCCPAFQQRQRTRGRPSASYISQKHWSCTDNTPSVPTAGHAPTDLVPVQHLTWMDVSRSYQSYS